MWCICHWRNKANCHREVEQKGAKTVNYICGFIVVVGSCIFAELFSMVVAWFFCDWMERMRKRRNKGNEI